ncbi:MAG TPA: glycosyltransferase family 4 protein [Fimbriimonadaceae bacterium]|jgi:glycosyltransferase involved in cell wall biosynthesis
MSETLENPIIETNGMLRGVRVLQIVNNAWALGFIRDPLRRMRRSGMEIAAIASPDEFLQTFEREENLRTFHVHMTRRITPMHDATAIRNIKKVIRQFRPDIVHAHTPKQGLMGMIAAKSCGVPIRIFHMHGLIAGHRNFRIASAAEKMTCNLATRVFCVSESAMNYCISRGNCDSSKITVVTNSVDSHEKFVSTKGRFLGRELRAKLGIPEEAPVAGFVGRVVKEKGVGELQEAWSKLRTEFPQAHLLIAGPEEPHDSVKPEVIKAFHDDPRVHMLGRLRDTIPVYEAMDVLVLPSYREGLPTVVLEAQSMKVPIVATDVPGCKEAMVDGKTGHLVPVRNSAALVTAISNYFADVASRRRAGEAGREFVLECFSPDPVWQKIETEYVSLLDRH